MSLRRNIKDYSRILIVEGYSDLLFYAEVLEHIAKGGVFIKEMNGRESLGEKLDAFLTPVLLAEKESIGIIIDADNNPAGAFQGLQQRLFEITNQRVPSPGTWTAGAPRLGAFIAPAADVPGEIETLVWRAILGDDATAPAAGAVESYLQSMDAIGHRERSPDKGRIGSLLAVLYDEDPRLGPGTRAKAIDLSRPEYDALKEFLGGL